MGLNIVTVLLLYASLLPFQLAWGMLSESTVADLPGTSLTARSPNFLNKIMQEPTCQWVFMSRFERQPSSPYDMPLLREALAFKIELDSSWKRVSPSIIRGEIETGCPGWEIAEWRQAGERTYVFSFRLDPNPPNKATRLDDVDEASSQCVLTQLQWFACNAKVKPPVKCVSETLLTYYPEVLREIWC